MKKLFTCALFVLLTGSVFGQIFTADNITYNIITANSVEVTGNGSNYTGSITIPSSVDYSGVKYNVTKVGDFSFQGCKSLTSVTIPSSVTSIGNSAYWGCSNLSTISIPNSVTYIDTRAFGYCTSLTAITLPDHLLSLEREVFTSCTGLTKLVLPNTVTYIGMAALAGCTNLNDITLSNTLNSIGPDAFNSVGITSIIIPNSVTLIDADAFWFCSKLTSIIIPNSVTTIKGDAFYNCTSLKEITIPNSVKSIEGQTFYNCTSLEKVHIPSSITNIGTSAFANCTHLSEIFINIDDPAKITISSDFNTYIFTNVPVNACALYVPFGSKVAYSGTAPWSNFIVKAPKKQTAQGKPITAQIFGFDNIIEFDYVSYFKLHNEFSFTSAHEFITALPTTMSNNITVCPSVVKETFKVNGTNEAATLQISDMNGKIVAKQNV